MSAGPTLIHPHPKSNLPGYLGYTPQLKFQCGHTYGYQTDKLLTDFSATHPSKCTSEAKLKLPDIPSTGKEDEKYVKQMVPGYTGFVPQHVFKYGQTYASGTEEAVAESKYRYQKGSHARDDLMLSVRNPNTKLERQPPRPSTHPGVNMRYVLSLGPNKCTDKRDFVEPPIPGYHGYVPRKEEHILGERYNVWTRHAYTHAHDTIQAKECSKQGLQLVTVKSDEGVREEGNRSIYSKRLGMIPNYTGFVPQRRFVCGNTYGDATRSMPVCFDTKGYSQGAYNETKKGVTPTVIPVRI